MKSKVSVVIPSYNKGPYLDDAISSAIALTYRPLEVIVVDDGSTDGSYGKALLWQSKHPDLVKVHEHSQRANKGEGASRNLGVDISEGRYICFLDADDVLLPHRLEKAVALLDADPVLDAVYEAVSVVSLTPRGSRDWQGRQEFWTVPRASGEQPAETILVRQSLWASCGVLIRRHLFEKTGPFSTFLKIGPDRHMWLKMALVGNLEGGELDHPIAVVRRGDDHAWFPSRVGDTYRDIWNTAMVFVWALRNRKRFHTRRKKALKEGFCRQIVKSIRVLREEGCCWRICVVATTALLVPSVLKERAFWGNLIHCFADRLSDVGSKGSPSR